MKIVKFYIKEKKTCFEIKKKLCAQSNKILLQQKLNFSIVEAKKFNKFS